MRWYMIMSSYGGHEHENDDRRDRDGYLFDASIPSRRQAPPRWPHAHYAHILHAFENGANVFPAKVYPYHRRPDLL